MAYYAAMSKPAVLKTNTLYALLGKTQAIENDFHDCIWDTSMGGPAWANCTRAVKQLLMAYIRLKLRQPPPPFHTYPLSVTGHTADDLRASIAAANLLLTISHNNGKCLTKFISATVLKGVTQAPGLYLMHPLTYGVTHESAESAPTTTPS